MNLLLALVVVIGSVAIGIAYSIPNEVWSAVAERIRTPRPDMLHELHRHWEAQDKTAADASERFVRSDQRYNPKVWCSTRIPDGRVCSRLAQHSGPHEGNPIWADAMDREPESKATPPN